MMADLEVRSRGPLPWYRTALLITMSVAHHVQGSWGEAELLKCHMHWHTGLLFLGLGDVDAALARYDAEVREVRQLACAGCATTHDAT